MEYESFIHQCKEVAKNHPRACQQSKAVNEATLETGSNDFIASYRYEDNVVIIIFSKTNPNSLYVKSINPSNPMVIIVDGKIIRMHGQYAAYIDYIRDIFSAIKTSA